MISPVLDQPEGDRDRRLHLPRLLHRPVPGLRDGEVRRARTSSSTRSRSSTTARATTRSGLADVFTRKFTEMGGKIVGDESLLARATPTSARSSPRIKRLKPEAHLRPRLLHRRRAHRAAGARARHQGAAARRRRLGLREAVRDRRQRGRGQLLLEPLLARRPEPARCRSSSPTYKATYGAVPDALAALGYDAAKVAIDAMKRAPDRSTARRSATRSPQTKDFPGVAGTITIDENRNAVKPAVVLQGRRTASTTYVADRQRRSSSMSDFLQHLINGLAAGTIYALVALGYTMVYGVLQAHQLRPRRRDHGRRLRRATRPRCSWARAASDRRSGVLLVFLVVDGRLRAARLPDRAVRLPAAAREPRLTALITAIGISFALSLRLSARLRARCPAPRRGRFPAIIQPRRVARSIGDGDVVIWNWQVISLLHRRRC